MIATVITQPTSNVIRSKKFRPLMWPLEYFTWFMVGLQAVLPFVPQALANAAEESRSATPPPAQMALPPVEQKVTVNRKVPAVTPPSGILAFSKTPTDKEISQARVFASPIVSIGKTTSTAENIDLATALVSYRNRHDPDDASAIENFLQKHPRSPRSLSLSGHLASHYRQTSQWSKALETYQQIWAAEKNNADLNGQQIVDQAVGELATVLITFGQTAELKALLASLNGRELHGAAAVKISDAKNALWQMENQPEKTFKCGPYSLSRVQAALDPSVRVRELIINERATTNGTSLYQNWLLSKKMGLKFQMAKKQPGAAIPLPAVAHWLTWHFSALTKYENGLYLVEDPMASQNWVSLKVLDNESSGYFLIPEGPLLAGWSPVTVAEGETIFGKGWPVGSDGDAGGGPGGPGGCGGGGGPPPAGGFGEGGPGTKPCKGMPQYTFNMLRIGLVISDVPLGYTPPRGPEVEFRPTYCERTIFHSEPFFYSNLGNQWTYDWLIFIYDNTTAPNGDVKMVDNGNGYSFTGYDSLTKKYAVQLYGQSQLTKTSDSSYQLLSRDGSIKIFSQPDSTNGARRVFLTSMQDPAGNTLSFTYDSNHRLVSVTDAIGQVTTLSYELSNDIYKITKVTDPFGRFASFAYNNSGQLTNITDEIGISSSFVYGNATGEADYINTMITPYGRTTFTNNFVNGYDFNGRWTEATDPLGGKERAEYCQEVAGMYNDPYNLYPISLAGFNVNSDTSLSRSYFWNKKTMQEMQNNIDFSKARQYAWDRMSGNLYLLSRTLLSLKQPMENARIWFSYPGAPYFETEGAMNKPSIIARVLDDGTSQMQQYQYNPIGKPTQSIDPMGRTTYYTYDTNQIDLLTVSQLASGATNLLASYTYNAQHLPLTSTDAAGSTTFFGYNAQGQLTAMTNALHQVVALTYDTNSYLMGIAGPLGMTNSYTYDAYGRVRTTTDSEGYTVTSSYDNLDRPTRTDYMDGTYEQVVYNYLDPSLMRDRNGHWTKQVHDALRHVTDTYDSLGQHTQMSWCTCGSLESITDPAGNVTTWLRDLQNRVTAKVYPDLTQTVYNYETNSSRLHSVTDAKNQSTVYSYFIDNNLKQVTYSNAVVATPSVTFTYDTNYNRMLTMVDGVGTNTYSYYPVAAGLLGSGKLSSVANTFAGSLLTYNYDSLGRITNRAIDGVAEQLTFDDLGRVTQIANTLGSFSNTYLRATELITTNFCPNGKQTVFNYISVTNDQRLAEIWNQNNDGNTLSKFDYTYDPTGQIMTWTQQSDVATNVLAMQYDPVNQLLAVAVRGNTAAGAMLKQYAYAYDSGGNRTSEQIGTGESGPVAISQSGYNANNQLTGRTGGSGQMLFSGSLSKEATVTVAGNTAAIDHATTNFTAYVNVTSGTNVIPVIATDYSGNSTTNNYQVVVTDNDVSKTLAFDLNGNQTSVITPTGTITYQWDAANRLVSITGPVNQSLFTYDGAGRRIQIIEKQNGVAISTNNFVWDGVMLCEQRDNTGNVTKRFFGEGEQIAGVSYYFTKDHLGSIREMTDSAGKLQARYDYDPYGRRTKISGSMDADFGFTGHYTHSASGLCLTLFRAYDPDLGRWLSRDPIAEKGGLNLYEYAEDNPLNKFDPYGLECPALDSVSANPSLAVQLEMESEGVATESLNLNSPLARSLARIGRGVRQGERAHHIIAVNDKRAIFARKVLTKFKINIDDPANGVGLPRALHEALHTNKYYEALEDAAKTWQNREEALADLQRIAQDLLTLAQGCQ